MSGCAFIHRRLLGHHAFRNDAEAMAFAWLIVKAAWRPVTVRYKGHRIELKRAQVAISQRDMAHALDRDKAWVERLWKRLKSEAMIETSVEAGVAVITICNYDEYQRIAPKREAPAEARGETVDEAVVRQSQGTEQEEEEKEENKSSEANASGCADPIKDLFDLGVSILKASGHSDKQARSLIGKWRKTKSDADVLAGLLDCRTRSISNPVEWLEKRFNGARYVSASGYEYRGDDKTVMREAEKRADWNTYWAAKSAVGQGAHA